MLRKVVCNVAFSALVLDLTVEVDAGVEDDTEVELCGVEEGDGMARLLHLYWGRRVL